MKIKKYNKFNEQNEIDDPYGEEIDDRNLRDERNYFKDPLDYPPYEEDEFAFGGKYFHGGQSLKDADEKKIEGELEESWWKTEIENNIDYILDYFSEEGISISKLKEHITKYLSRKEKN